ncbi:MAG: glycoside hydrolase family 16 protein [Planctomycetota bacterium]
MRVLLFAIIINFLFLSTQVPAGVIWEDTFSDPKLNTGIWTAQVGGHGWGNGELQYYTNRLHDNKGANAYIENGKLVLEARREDYEGKQFTSARLTTKGNLTYKYGSLEARIKVPNLANGLWPAFWLLGNNIDQVRWPACGELDIMEMGSAEAIREGAVDRKVTAAAHWESGGKTADYSKSMLTEKAGSDGYHVFKLEWTPKLMTVSVDDTSFWEFDISGGERADLEEYHKPMFIILNLAVGGWNYVEITDPNEITASMPAKMYIDWIRLSENEWTEYYNANDKANAINKAD